MKTLESQYLGDLRTSCQHLRSGVKLVSDAPVDNNGKGASFSPTDLVAAALGSCMMTVMGIYADKTGIELKELHWDTTKIMASNPRRIERVVLNFYWSQPIADEKQIARLKEIALNCPVAKSLHPDLVQDVKFNF